jgi:hypothetical protein
MSSKHLIVAALALAGTLGVGVAQAHGSDDVQWSVTIGSPVYGVPAYGQPVYGQPVYEQPVYGARVISGPEYRYEHHHRYDREPTRWDRDGDGIPNRYDHHDDRWHRRDDDGGWRR